MNILYVEDTPGDVELVRMELAEHAPHYKLDIVGTLREAMERLQAPNTYPYNLVLADLRLPDGDSLALVNYIREHNLPLAVVMITGLGDEETAVAVLKAGADDYIVKRGNYLARLPQTLEEAFRRFQAGAARYSRPLHVLYAEHNEADIDLTRRFLARYARHIQLDVVHTADEVLRRLPEQGPVQTYDLLLLDYKLPGMNALEALKELRQKRGLDLPVVLVTGQGDDAVATQSLKLGATDYIVKNVGYLFQLPSVMENAFHRTQLWREQAALRASEEKYRMLITNLPLGVVIICKGRVVFANPAMACISGYTVEELLALSPDELNALIHPEDRDWVLKRLRDRLAGKPVPPAYEFRFIHKDGSVRYVELNAELVEYQGQPATQATCIDITGRKQSEDALKETNRRLEETLTRLQDTQQQLIQQERLAAVGQLAAGIAHDFNNILTSINGFAELLQMRPDMPPEERQNKLDHIIQQGQRAAHLVRQILDFSRKSIRQPRQLNLVPVLYEAVRFLERTIPERVHIKVKVEAKEYTVYADPAQFQQMLTNLAVNARDAMPNGGQLSLHLWGFTLPPGEPPPCPDMPPGEWVALSVADTGVGIPQDILPRIFEPFFTTKNVGEGSGLGLAQVYGIVKQHEGFIKADSQVGRGTTVTIYLPTGPVPEETSPEPPPPEVPAGQQQTILLVEDEEIVLEVCQAMLEELNYRVVAAKNGRQALDILANPPAEIALVLTDMVMPDMDGPTLLQTIQRDYPDIKVVLMTGYPLDEEGRRYLQPGRVDYISKPLNIPNLARVINRTIRP